MADNKVIEWIWN